MDKLIYVLVILLVIKEVADIIGKNKKKNPKKSRYKKEKFERTEALPKTEEKRDYTSAYKPKYVMSANEKNAFFKIKAAAEELGYTALSKVRLYDLVEPKQITDNGAKWKIQAKHVDFVILDKTLTARYVIELTDSSHDAEDRAERDQFVAAVLRNCGYKVLFTRNIEKDRLISWIREQEGHYIPNKQ